MEVRGRTTRNFLCSASYIFLCLDKVLLVAPMLFLGFSSLLSILSSLYWIPKLLQNLHEKQKLSILIYLVTIRKHLTTHLQSSFDSYLLCLWYFVEGLL